MVPKLDMRKFSWDSASRQLMASASELGWRASAPWPDTIRIKSHHTGVTEQFSRSQTLVSPEGECHGLMYSAANVNLGVRVTVFNG